MRAHMYQDCKYLSMRVKHQPLYALAHRELHELPKGLQRMRALHLPIVPKHEETTVPYTQQTAFCVRRFSSRKCRGRASGETRADQCAPQRRSIHTFLRFYAVASASTARYTCNLHPVTCATGFAMVSTAHFKLELCACHEGTLTEQRRELASCSLCSASFSICSLLLLSGRPEQNWWRYFTLSISTFTQLPPPVQIKVCTDRGKKPQ